MGTVGQALLTRCRGEIKLNRKREDVNLAIFNKTGKWNEVSK